MTRNHTVYRILVDSESSVDILYSDCLTKIKVPKEQMERTTQPLYGFTGDSIIPQGMVKLSITAEEKHRQATVMANFVVIKKASQYSDVIRK